MKKKLKYVPPHIHSITAYDKMYCVDGSLADGSSGCTAGPNIGAHCSVGSGEATWCGNGTSAGDWCIVGTSGNFASPCQVGGTIV